MLSYGLVIFKGFRFFYYSVIRKRFKIVFMDFLYEYFFSFLFMVLLFNRNILNDNLLVFLRYRKNVCVLYKLVLFCRKIIKFIM